MEASTVSLPRVAAMAAAHPMLVGVGTASEVLGLDRGWLLHAGPPVTWEQASGPMRGAIIGALLYEGWADDEESATELAAGGSVRWEPCHHRGAVGPMAGIVSPSMPVWVLEDAVSGRRSACTLNEGLGKVLRYGAYSPDVLTRLRWMGDVLGPLFQRAVRSAGPIDVTGILTQMLQMGDEAHNRNRAGTLMLLRDLSPAMVSSGFDSADVAAALRFIGGNDHFFLNLAMPACKLALDAARGIEGSTIFSTLNRTLDQLPFALHWDRVQRRAAPRLARMFYDRRITSLKMGDYSFSGMKQDQKSLGYRLQTEFAEGWTLRQNLRLSRAGVVTRQERPLAQGQASFPTPDPEAVQPSKNPIFTPASWMTSLSARRRACAPMAVPLTSG